MAEGYARHYGKDLLEIYSAGTHPAAMVHPDAIRLMEEEGIDISMQYSKGLSEIPDELDILITMGCGVECPYFPSEYKEDWIIEDPIGLPMAEFRRIRDIIKTRVLDLLENVRSSGNRETLINKLKER